MPPLRRTTRASSTSITGVGEGPDRGLPEAWIREVTDVLGNAPVAFPGHDLLTTTVQASEDSPLLPGPFHQLKYSKAPPRQPS